MKLFVVGEETHHADDPRCPACWESYPEQCVCGGLIHAAGGREEDADGNVLLVTLCDHCGRSQDELDEAG